MPKASPKIMALLLLTISFWVSGCITDGNYGPNPGGTGSGNGRIDGYVYTNGYELLVCGTTTIPDGYVAVGGAVATLGGSSLTATTDAAGAFSLSEVPAGDYPLSVVANSLGLSWSGTIKAISGTVTKPNEGNPATLEGYVWSVTYTASPSGNLWKAYVIGDSSSSPPDIPANLGVAGHSDFLAGTPSLVTTSLIISLDKTWKNTADTHGHFSVTGALSGAHNLYVTEEAKALPEGIILMDGTNNKPIHILFESPWTATSLGNISY